jgi:hypothetical protein
MSGVFRFLGEWVKKFFFVATALAVAGLNLLMLMDVFRGDILFVILGMVFFSIATWVYLITAFSAREDSNRSGAQIAIAWAGLGISLVGELSMATFEILRMQSFIITPAWVQTVTIIVIEAAVIIHLLLGISYFAASEDYNETVSRIFENSRRRAADEKLRQARASAELAIQEEATDTGIELTRTMLAAALPIVAERKAKLMALEISKTFGMDGDLAMQRAFSKAIKEYRQEHNSMAYAVIDGDAKDMPEPAVIEKPLITPDPTIRRKAEK